jgi:hypothetical protein
VLTEERSPADIEALFTNENALRQQILSLPDIDATEFIEPIVFIAQTRAAWYIQHAIQEKLGLPASAMRLLHASPLLTPIGDLPPDEIRERAREEVAVVVSADQSGDRGDTH